MLRKLSILLLLLSAALAGTAYADPPGRVARLNHAAGAVSFAPADAPEQWTQGVINRPLTAGDRLWIDGGGRAELHVGSTAIRLASATSLDFLNLDDDTLQARLAQGVMNLRVRDLAQGETIEIATPTGAVLIRRPGSYRIAADDRSDVTRVAVNFGEAEILTPVERVIVPSGQAAVIAANAPASYELSGHASGDDFDRWSAERDRREDGATSARYVSRDMTGYEELDQYGSWQTLPEYGAVWVPTQVARDWAPYRYGHWAWVSPWGWTWIDDAPWGFAPSHYGRWVWVNDYWAWAPGTYARRPVYAPALVAFVGGASFSISGGPAVGWFPLGWREPYIPWYRASHAHVRNLNGTHWTDNNTYARHGNYAYRTNPRAVTVVPQQTFASSRPVGRSNLRVGSTELARAQVLQAGSPAEPLRASFAERRAGQRPPAQVTAREVVAASAPAAAAQSSVSAPGSAATPRFAERDGRVRVLSRDRTEARAGERTRSEAAVPAPVQAAPAITTQTAPAVRSAPVVTPQSAPAAAVQAAPVVTPRVTPPASTASQVTRETDERFRGNGRRFEQQERRAFPTQQPSQAPVEADRRSIQRPIPPAATLPSQAEERRAARLEQQRAAPIAQPQAPAIARPAAPMHDARAMQRPPQAEARPAAAPAAARQQQPAEAGNERAVREQQRAQRGRD
ncbi:MAG TPA: DUF6600 domain-containing protein [Burkholderiales bacterium]|nr:DUF6600 domain-containing protein [Burkholderiales bacterium]